MESFMLLPSQATRLEMIVFTWFVLESKAHYVSSKQISSVYWWVHWQMTRQSFISTLFFMILLQDHCIYYEDLFTRWITSIKRFLVMLKDHHIQHEPFIQWCNVTIFMRSFKSHSLGHLSRFVVMVTDDVLHQRQGFHKVFQIGRF